MITVKRSTENTAVALELEIGFPLPDGMLLSFWRSGLTEVETRLLAVAIRGAIAANMTEIRRVSYLRGWRDKASHKNKEGWFASHPSVMPWERKDAGL